MTSEIRQEKFYLANNYQMAENFQTNIGGQCCLQTDTEPTNCRNFNNKWRHHANGQTANALKNYWNFYNTTSRLALLHM